MNWAPGSRARRPARYERAELGRRRGSHLRPEDDRVAVRVDRDAVAVVHLALEQLERERILHQPLDGSLERPRAERRIVALAPEEAPGRVRHVQLDPPRREAATEMAELDVDDPRDLVASQRREDHHLV